MPEEINEIILLVEDDLGTAELVREKLGESGKNVVHVKSGKEARAWLEHNHPRLILLDYSLPDMTGAEFVKQTSNMPPFIVVTGAGNENTAVTMMKRGARDYLAKDPYFLENLPLVVDQVLRELATERQLAESESQREAALEALRASEERFHLMFEEHSAIMLLLDPNSGRIIDANRAAQNYYGYPVETLKQMNIQDINILTSEEAVESLKQALHERSSFFVLPHRLSNGQTRFIEVHSSPIDINGKPILFSIIHDITERKRAESELLTATEALDAANFKLQIALTREKQLAHTDVLTGINNRRYLFELAEHEFDIAKRYQHPLSAIMFDIDHFKDVNDTFGHAAGDQMLQLVTQAACAELRSADVIGRYGGEEFVIVMPMTNAQQALPLAERIREGVAALHMPTEKGDASVTLSIGIAEAKHASGESVDSIINCADKAMYAAKQAGRNRTKTCEQ